jgi:Zn-dependent peptidase ImmA (M78 family)/transcriptional regulator with XRE-family HTH domain
MPEHANGGLLRVARQRVGFAQGDAARRLDIAQVTLSRYENGVAHPSGDVLDRAALVYGLPRSFFLQPDAVFGAPVSVHPLWRKKHDVTARELDGIVAELNIRAMHLRRLLEAVDLAPRSDIPRLDPEEYGGDVEQIAGTVRAHWLVPAGPFPNLTRAVERAGALVVHSAMGGSAVSGVTVNVPGLPPLIMLNADQPADRMRFTLAHELGHVVMHRFPGPEMEREANEFASALLMPAADIRIAMSGRIDMRRLAALKPEWRVSMQGLLYRAQALGLIDKGEAGWLWRQFSASRMRTREPPELDFEVEKPVVVERIVKLHLDDFGMKAAQLAEMLHGRADMLRDLYGIGESDIPPRARLRLVQ